MTTVLLSQLQFGHDNPGFSLNSRTTGRMDDVPELAASIFAKDLIEPLVIVWRQTEIGDEPFVVDGNRRLAAMRLLVEDGPERAGGGHRAGGERRRGLRDLRRGQHRAHLPAPG
jgi:hypothetical protein